MIIEIGAVCFGTVVGWVTSRTLRRSTPGGLSDIATVIGAVGGATVTGIYKPASNADAFGYYSIGLAGGFFLYLVLAIIIAKWEGGNPVGDWLGSEPRPAGAAGQDQVHNPGVHPPK
jgi:hypothetical protein